MKKLIIFVFTMLMIGFVNAQTIQSWVKTDSVVDRTGVTYFKLAPAGIGINTTNPQEALHVNGNVKCDTNYVNTVYFEDFNARLFTASSVAGTVSLMGVNYFRLSGSSAKPTLHCSDNTDNAVLRSTWDNYGFGFNATDEPSLIRGGTHVATATATGFGVYNTTPAQELDLTGKFQFSEISYVKNLELTAGTDTTHSAATWFPLFADGISEEITIAASTAWTFEIIVTGTNDAQSKTFSYKIIGNITRDASNNTTLNGSSVTTIYETDSDFDCRVVADDINEALDIQVQDATSGGDKIYWGAWAKLNKVTY